MVDIGQIEFVRGPEGALYGRIRQAIDQYTSRPPTRNWTEQAQAAFGNYSYRNIRASISGPF